MLRNRYLLLFMVCLLIIAAYVWNSNQHEQYPYPILYPGAEKMRYSEMIIHDSPVRSISFETSQAPERILAFYATELSYRKWELEKILPNKLEFSYYHGDAYPIFLLSVIASVEKEQTKVEIQQTLVNQRPSDWGLWPPWPYKNN